MKKFLWHMILKNWNILFHCILNLPFRGFHL